MASVSSPTFKVCLIGDSGVGKSTLLASLKKGGVKVLGDPTATLSLDICYHQMKARGKTFCLQIWDTAGSERFSCLTPNYLRNVKLLFFVYDITSEESFESIPTWFQIIDGLNTDSVYYLVGNKTDLENKRAVTQDNAHSYAQSNGWDYFETSALNGVNVSFLFDQVGKELVYRFPDEFGSPCNSDVDPDSFHSTLSIPSLNLAMPAPKRNRQPWWSAVRGWCF